MAWYHISSFQDSKVYLLSVAFPQSTAKDGLRQLFFQMLYLPDFIGKYQIPGTWQIIFSIDSYSINYRMLAKFLCFVDEIEGKTYLISEAF